MEIKKWTDDELASTRDKLEEWCEKQKKSGKVMWVVTALLGAFALSTGVVFIFFDGITLLSIVLIILGVVTCFTWYQSEKRRKNNINFLEEVKREITHRAKRAKHEK
ncbi:MAG: hypothetical protein IPI97_13405 [Nitrosomonas sp.]|jgi:Flp pilus assembly protein TadB|nr:hypothetical protein [Nitrosomonas sp.]MBK7365939.1 hypothetical protein [Nitrosomonas sp.]